ncbi:enoyl-CoA hydratase/isomerase family protein [Mycobacterium sp. DSM 3803]|nr:enoyl-CoA hydratase/isomerase family protein [Mycobacterium sp. DSM 3803]
MASVENRLAPGAPAPSAHHVELPYAGLLYAEDGAVARLTLNRPQAHNALSMQLSNEFIHALERVRDSTTIKVLVVEGTRHRTSAGGQQLPAPIMQSVSIFRRVSWIITIIHEKVPHIALDESELRSAVRPTAAASSFETWAELRWCGHDGGSPQGLTVRFIAARSLTAANL